MQQRARPDTTATIAAVTRVKGWLPAILVAALYLVAFFATLPRYGMTWDEPENFYIGDRHLELIETLDARWLRFPEAAFITRRLNDANRPAYIAELDRFRRESARDFTPANQGRFVTRTLAFAWPYPPVANIAAAITNEVLFEWTHLLAPLPAHHAAIGIFWAALIAGTYFFARRLAGGGWSGGVAGLVASGTLAVAPRLWGPSHNNIKDVPEAALFGLTLIALHRAVADDRPLPAVVAGILAGLAVGIKPNGVFALVVGALWLIGSRSWSGLARRTRRAIVGAPVIGAATFFLTWPYLWPHPLVRLRLFLQYGADVATGAPPVPPGYAFLYALITIPPIVALLALAAAPRLRGLWSARGRPGLLLGLWLLVPILRVSLPGVGFYDGIRQYMEYWPALAVVAGLGAATAFDRLAGTGLAMRRLAAGAVVAAALAPQIASDVRLHPYEDVYFNLPGGLRTAQRLGVRWSTDYWGSSYLEAARWANAHLEHGAAILAPNAGFLLNYGGIRPDITVYGPADPVPAGAAYFAYVTRRELYGDLERRFDEQTPVFEIRRSGAPILRIHRLPG
jgi:hypothetical protein